MAKINDSSIVSVLHPTCCGRDVHKEMIAACPIATDEHGSRIPAS